LGIYDREYIRKGPGSRSGLGAVKPISVNMWLIVINVAVLVLQMLLSGMSVQLTRLVQDPASGQLVRQVYLTADPLLAYGHFSTYQGFQRLEVWRLLTFQFLHGNLVHLLFNMFGLFIFGGIVEERLGRKRYLAFYLVCGIVGGLTYLVLNLLGVMFKVQLPALLINDPTTPLVGASAGVFGVIMACAYIAPNTMVMLLFPPIPLKLKWMAYGYVVIALLNLLRGGPNAGGDAAHVGGAAAGAFFIRNAHLLRDFFDVFNDSRKPKADRRRGGRAGGRSPAADDPDEQEMDRILAKVQQTGIQGLTDTEKRTLQRATEFERRKRGL